MKNIENWYTRAVSHRRLSSKRCERLENEYQRIRRRQAVLMSDLIDHYIVTELSPKVSWHSPATRIVYNEFLELSIRPHWSVTDIRDVRTVAVEQWLRQLRRQNNEHLSSSTKAKIRGLMSVLFNHAIRYEWLEQVTSLLFFDQKFHTVFAADAVIEPAKVVAGQISLIIARIEMIRYVESLQSDSKAIFLFEASGC